MKNSTDDNLTQTINKLLDTPLLSGKDYFTITEAAAYCCISRAKFYQIRSKYGIMPGTFEGKQLYRKADLRRAIESQLCPGSVAPKAQKSGTTSGGINPPGSNTNVR